MSDEQCKTEIPEAVREACETLCAYLQIDVFQAASSTLWHTHNGRARRIMTEVMWTVKVEASARASAKAVAAATAKALRDFEPHLHSPRRPHRPPRHDGEAEMTLIEKLRSQIGDDVQHVFDHQALFRLAADRIEELEAENFALAAQQCLFSDGSGLSGDEWGHQYCAMKRRAETAEAKLATARNALEDIARQKRTDELETEYDVEVADFEGGYDAIIDVARAAIRALKSTSQT